VLLPVAPLPQAWHPSAEEDAPSNMGDLIGAAGSASMLFTPEDMFDRACRDRNYQSSVGEEARVYEGDALSPSAQSKEDACREQIEIVKDQLKLQPGNVELCDTLASLYQDVEYFNANADAMSPPTSEQ